MRLLIAFLALGACFAHAQNPAPQPQFNFTLISTRTEVLPYSMYKGQSDILNDRIRFSIEAVDQDGWFRLTGDPDPYLSGIIWSLLDSGGQKVDPFGGTGFGFSSSFNVISGGTFGENNTFRVAEGETVIMELNTFIEPTVSGFYSTAAHTMLIGASRNEIVGSGIYSTPSYALPPSFKTQPAFAQAAVPEPSTFLTLVSGLGVLGSLRRRK